MSDEHTYKFNVSMSCGGCSGAIDRVLKKLDGKLPPFQRSPPDRSANPLSPPGVKSHDVSLENQTATVVAEPSLSYETVLSTIAKTGKKVNSGFADGEEKSVVLA
jgi:copper chaperone